jgi:hypothetical protein
MRVRARGSNSGEAQDATHSGPTHEQLTNKTNQRRRRPGHSIRPRGASSSWRRVRGR